MMTDFPKLHCPFIRKDFDVSNDDWKKLGRKLMLRQSKAYLVVDEVNPGYEWVFDDKDTIAVEKLDGTNIKLTTENGRLTELQNRKNVIDPLQIIKGKAFLVEGVFTAIQKGYVEMNGEQAGELIGPKLQSNPYKLTSHLWYPFEKAVKHLCYRSFHEYECNYENLSFWFREFLFSRFYAKRNKDNVLAEGVVFYNLRRKAEGKIWMAKLRRDMFPWYYEGAGVSVIDYEK